MSYSISITGHKDHDTEDAAHAFEEGVAAKAREFVATLEGVTSATSSFGKIGPQNLQEEK